MVPAASADDGSPSATTSCMSSSPSLAHSLTIKSGNSASGRMQRARYPTVRAFLSFCHPFLMLPSQDSWEKHFASSDPAYTDRCSLHISNPRARDTVLQSRISHNDSMRLGIHLDFTNCFETGNTWKFLTPPATDSAGNNCIRGYSDLCPPVSLDLFPQQNCAYWTDKPLAQRHIRQPFACWVLVVISNDGEWLALYTGRALPSMEGQFLFETTTLKGVSAL